MTRRRGWTVGLAACVLAAGPTGCGVADRHEPAPPGEVSASRTTGTHDPDAPGPGAHPRVAPVDGARPDHVVRLEGPLTRLYEAPSLLAFVGQRAVSNVIVGDVTELRPLVGQPGTTVETLLLVDVLSQRAKGRPVRVQVREQGGVVTMESVRSDFEAKLGRTLSARELRETVDYRFEGLPHAQVGDRVLLVVADDDGAARYAGLARLVAADDTVTGDPTSSLFRWPGLRPNPQWQESVRASSLLKPVRR